MGDHHLDLLKEAFESDSTVAKFGRDLKRSSPDDVVANAFELVKQRIRYYGNFEKMHGIVPRKPAIVIKNGYGDCKEMSFLLVLLLRNAGLNADPCLVSTWGEFQPLKEYPEFNFNHTVVCVQSLDGAFSFYDPTNKFAGARQSVYPLLYQTAFVLRRGGSFLTPISPVAGTINNVSSELAISKDAQSGRGCCRVRSIFLGLPPIILIPT